MATGVRGNNDRVYTVENFEDLISVVPPVRDEIAGRISENSFYVDTFETGENAVRLYSACFIYLLDLCSPSI